MYAFYVFNNLLNKKFSMKINELSFALLHWKGKGNLQYVLFLFSWINQIIIYGDLLKSIILFWRGIVRICMVTWFLHNEKMWVPSDMMNDVLLWCFRQRTRSSASSPHHKNFIQALFSRSWFRSPLITISSFTSSRIWLNSRKICF